ncbi:hypothetical protein M3J09_006464 [Ascochyta lentis]
MIYITEQNSEQKKESRTCRCSIHYSQCMHGYQRPDMKGKKGNKNGIYRDEDESGGMSMSLRR